MTPLLYDLLNGPTANQSLHTITPNFKEYLQAALKMLVVHM